MIFKTIIAASILKISPTLSSISRDQINILAKAQTQPKESNFRTISHEVARRFRTGLGQVQESRRRLFQKRRRLQQTRCRTDPT